MQKVGRDDMFSRPDC